MALTYTQLQTRATLLASFEAWSDTAVAPDWATLVNRAWEQFSWDAELVVSQQNVTTAVGTVSYTLTGQVKRILDVVYDTASAKLPLRRSSEEWERNANAAWRYAANGTPTRYTFNPFNTISLVAPPDAIKTVSVRGYVQGTDLSAGSDVLPIPGILEEAVCLLAAYFQGKVYGQGEGMERLDKYLAEYQRLVAVGLSYGAIEAQGS